MNHVFRVSIKDIGLGITREYAEIARSAGEAKLKVGLYRTSTFPDQPFEIINVERM